MYVYWGKIIFLINNLIHDGYVFKEISFFSITVFIFIGKLKIMFVKFYNKIKIFANYGFFWIAL